MSLPGHPSGGMIGWSQKAIQSRLGYALSSLRVRRPRSRRTVRRAESSRDVPHTRLQRRRRPFRRPDEGSGQGLCLLPIVVGRDGDVLLSPWEHFSPSRPGANTHFSSPHPWGGVSPFGEGGIRKVASTHFEKFGNLAMLFFPQAPILKCMEAVRMVTDLSVPGQMCSVVFCRAALESPVA